MPERLGNDVPDGAMCFGSEERGVHFVDAEVQCGRCDSLVPAYPGSFLVPVHEAPDHSVVHAHSCELCWADFIADMSTDHYCCCRCCTDRLPTEEGGERG